MPRDRSRARLRLAAGENQLRCRWVHYIRISVRKALYFSLSLQIFHANPD